MICLLTWLTIVLGRFAASSRYCDGEIFKSFLLVICCVIPSFLTHPRQPPFSAVGLYVAFPSGRNVVCTLPTDTKRFKPATQHNHPLALHGISLLTPHRYSRLSMQKAFSISPFAKSSGKVSRVFRGVEQSGSSLGYQEVAGSNPASASESQSEPLPVRQTERL